MLIFPLNDLQRLAAGSPPVSIWLLAASLGGQGLVFPFMIVVLDVFLWCRKEAAYGRITVEL